MILSFIVGQVVRRVRARRIAIAATAFLIPLLLVQPGTAQDQGGGGFSIDQIKQMLQGHTSASQLLGNSSDQSNAQQEIILQPSALPATDLPISRLEQVMSTRAGIKLRQFGYDQFGVGRPVSIPQMGAVQDDYILGPGDEIDVSLRGQQNAEYQATVGRDGRVILPMLNPISAAGRTFGDFRRDLLSATSRAYLSTKAFVSISRLREISVLVTGEVNNPGARIMTGLSTAADAIVISGGVRKTGSLRAIRVVRNGRSINADLYNLITQRGNEHTVHLADGDRIIVPPLGRTVAVSGWIRLPGIFELSPGTSSISVRGLSSLAGGFEVRGKYRLSVLRQESDGQSRLTKVDERSLVKDGEILSVQLAAEQTTNQAELTGGMALAGRYAITDGMKLSDLIRQPGAMGNSPDTTFGIISRRDASSYIRHLIPFTPAAVLKGAEDMPLQTADVVRVFSTTEAHMLRDSMRRFRQFKILARGAERDPQGLVTTQATSAELLPSDAEFLDQLGYSQAALATNPPVGIGPVPGVSLIPPGPAPVGSPSQIMTNPNGSLPGTYPCAGLSERSQRRKRVFRCGISQRGGTLFCLSCLSEWDTELFGRRQRWKHQSNANLPGQFEHGGWRRFPTRLSGRRKWQSGFALKCTSEPAIRRFGDSERALRRASRKAFFQMFHLEIWKSKTSPGRRCRQTKSPSHSFRLPASSPSSPQYSPVSFWITRSFCRGRFAVRVYTSRGPVSRWTRSSTQPVARAAGPMAAPST